MRTRSTLIPTLLALALAIPLAGCGDGSSNDNIFIGTTPTHGNGRHRHLAHRDAGGRQRDRDAGRPGDADRDAGRTPPAANDRDRDALGRGSKAGDHIVVTETVDKSYGGLRSSSVSRR
jgi:hypothetical protein